MRLFPVCISQIIRTNTSCQRAVLSESEHADCQGQSSSVMTQLCWGVEGHACIAEVLCHRLLLLCLCLVLLLQDVADAVAQMHVKGRYRELLLIVETCQAATLYSKIQ